MNEGYIYVEKWKDNSFVDFWFVTGDEQLYMFSTRYSKNLYEYFKYKRTVKHILSRHKWNRNTTPEALSTTYDYIKINKTVYNSKDEIVEKIKEADEIGKNYVSFVWGGTNEIEESVWKEALKGTDISNLSFTCLGVEGRRMYMINLVN